jgi:RIB43A
MYKVEIPKDDLSNAAIHRRQKLDEERKQRIFNPKVRCMGVSLLNRS